jgi:hypothetical protein
MDDNEFFEATAQRHGWDGGIAYSVESDPAFDLEGEDAKAYFSAYPDQAPAGWQEEQKGPKLSAPPPSDLRL